jgi:predicted hotdog family 3-hydroxylacyl-ACP dehydratase
VSGLWDPPYPAIAALLPHRAPMLLLDAIASADADGITCRARVADDAGATTPVAGTIPPRPIWTVELMAQACAAWLGLGAYRRGEPIAGGWLVGVRDMVVHVDALARATGLTISARHGFGGERLASFDCEVSQGEVALCRATLNVLRHPA